MSSNSSMSYYEDEAIASAVKCRSGLCPGARALGGRPFTGDIEQMWVGALDPEVVSHHDASLVVGLSPNPRPLGPRIVSSNWYSPARYPCPGDNWAQHLTSLRYC
jgi:hypothetical protein